MRTTKFLLAAFAVLALATAARAAADGVVKETLVSEGTKRSYYLFVPPNVTAAKPAPLILSLHGSGDFGSTMVELWKELAAKEGVIVVGPNAYDYLRWVTPKDGPAFLYDLVEALKAKYPVDARRVYLFGHSGGSGFALNMSLLESEYFAATAVHASATCRGQYLGLAARKIPFAIFAGTADPVFPIREVRATRDLLAAHGFAVQYTEMPGHDHNYHARAAEINRAAWDFLKRHALAADARYTQHQFKK